MKQYGYIYKHTNTQNNKVYIGQSIQPEAKRFRKADKTYNSYKSCPAFFNALQKYTWNAFQTEILYIAFDQEALNKAEEYFINFYNSIAPNGYNSVMLVDGSVQFTPEIKQKISDSRKRYYAALETKPEAVNKKEHVFVDGVECKECSRCKQTMPLEKFGAYAARWDGLNIYCKNCNSSYRSRYKHKKLSEEDFKKSYENRQKDNAKKFKELYQKNATLKKKISEQRSIIIIATNIDTGIETKFNSALEAKKFGFHNTNISTAIKKQSVYKNHTWRKA